FFLALIRLCNVYFFASGITSTINLQVVFDFKVYIRFIARNYIYRWYQEWIKKRDISLELMLVLKALELVLLHVMELS
ncbi:hypothetical protein TNCT_19371, partial [Trichonephila clavata]